MSVESPNLEGLVKAGVRRIRGYAEEQESHDPIGSLEQLTAEQLEADSKVRPLGETALSTIDQGEYDA